MQDHYPDYFTMGTGNGEPGGGVYQGGESAYGNCTRRSTAADETGNAGALVRHRAGYGYGRVWTEWQGTAGTGAVCCTRLHTSLVREIMGARGCNYPFAPFPFFPFYLGHK